MPFKKPWGNYLLENIIETPAPESISYLPETFAWKLILVCMIGLGLKKSYSAWKRYKQNAYRREAIAWLKQCNLSDQKQLRQLPILLRKTAILANDLSVKVANENNTDLTKHTTSSQYASEQHALIRQLSGIAWLAWLDKNCPKTHFCLERATFPNDKLLLQLAYSPDLELNDSDFSIAVAELVQQITLWIKFHDLITPALNNEHRASSEVITVANSQSVVQTDNSANDSMHQGTSR